MITLLTVGPLPSVRARDARVQQQAAQRRGLGRGRRRVGLAVPPPLRRAERRLRRVLGARPLVDVLGRAGHRGRHRPRGLRHGCGRRKGHRLVISIGEWTRPFVPCYWFFCRIRTESPRSLRSPVIIITLLLS